MTDNQTRLAIVVPVYNDWESAKRLVDELAGVLSNANTTARVVLVDDGSTSTPAALTPPAKDGVHAVEVIRLWCNRGHQAAICIGLGHVLDQPDCDVVVVMDGDGEDRPEDVPRLVEAVREHGDAIVFAGRTIRQEGLVFRCFYRLYCLFFRFLTGCRVAGGNFSAMPAAKLPSVLAVAEIWNHYAAAVLKARFPVISLPSRRGKRYAGKSKMNFSAFVTHGFSAISVFGDTASVRMFLLSGTKAVGCVLGLLVLWILGCRTDLCVPVWLYWVFALGCLFWALAGSVFLAASMLILHMRSLARIRPLPNVEPLIREVVRLD